MIHRLLTAASVVSLLLCAATLLLWMRACLRPYWFITDHQERHALVFYRDETDLMKFESVDPEGRIRDVECLPSMWVQWSHMTFWTALLPLLWLALDIKRRVRAADKSGLCSCCGYDLRASKDRCPECGTPIPPDAGAKA
ncbi:MAG TPA: hypothetical protein VGI81_16085 [Tepidisphaeraceae bacterium]|jgi:hypothetical protein